MSILTAIMSQRSDKHYVDRIPAMPSGIFAPYMSRIRLILVEMMSELSPEKITHDVKPLLPSECKSVEQNLTLNSEEMIVYQIYSIAPLYAS